MDDLYAELLRWLQTHGMLGVFLFMVVENLAVPFPAALGYIVAQGLISAGYFSHLSAFMVINAGHLTGAGITYYSGRAGHGFLVRRFSHSRRLMRAREVLQTWYGRYGVLTILAGRLIGHVRPWASLVAGMAHVPPFQFWLWTLIGSLIHTALAMLFTVWGWRLWVAYPWIRVPAVLLVLVLFYGLSLGGVLREVLRRRRRQAGETVGQEAGQ